MDRVKCTKVERVFRRHHGSPSLNECMLSSFTDKNSSIMLEKSEEEKGSKKRREVNESYAMISVL